jgi:heme-degrading monooxygenase HmoA
MFARVQTVHQPAEKLDEMTEVARRQLPAARDLPGFRGFTYLVDRDNAKAMVVSLWETEDDARQMEANATIRQRTAAETGIQSPPSEFFEVALQTS